MDAPSVLDAIAGRRSVRAFLPTPVETETVSRILEVASRAPSGTNIQPWSVHVVTGAARDRLARAGRIAAEAGEGDAEYEYLPAELKEPWLSRRRQIGHALYEKYGIPREDFAARKAAMLRNFDFFNAPVGLFFCMARSHALGAWLDCGMFMQNVMIAARAFGLETCPQQAWCDVGSVVHRELQIPDSQIVLSGMAIGFADRSAPANSLISPRMPVTEFSCWHEQ